MLQNFLGAIALILMFAVVSADAAVLSINEAIGMALENNSQVKAARFSRQAAGHGVSSTNSRYLPVLSFEELLSVSNSPTSAFMMNLDEGRFKTTDFASADAVNNPSTRHDFKTALTLQQPVYVPSLAPLKAIAVSEENISVINADAVSQQVAFHVFQTYLDVQKNQAQLKAADKAVADARENMRLATVRSAAGVGLKSDELRSRTHLSAMEQQQMTTFNSLALSRMRLILLTGMPDGHEFQISDNPVSVRVPPFDDQLIKLAFENRAEMRQAHSELDKAASAVKLANADYLPTVGAFASYQQNSKSSPFSPDNDAWSAGVSLKWNIFDGFRRYSDKKRAVSGQSSARELMESVAKDVTYQLREGYMRREESGKQLEVARHTLLDAEETARLVARRYENSLATMVELLDAQMVLNNARSGLVDSETAYALSGGRIYYVTGTFVKEMLK